MAWITATEFKTRTKLCGLTDDEINTLVAKAQKEARDYIFKRRDRTYTTLEDADRKYVKLDLGNYYIQDVPSYDGTVDSSDINVYLLNQKTYEETNLSGAITTFRPKYGYIEFASGYPTSGTEMHIEYYLGRYEFSDMKSRIDDLVILLALRSILNDKPMAAAAAMTDAWSMNGVTFSAGAMNTSTYWENITVAINKIIFDLQPLRVQSRDLRRFDNPYLTQRL